MLNQVKGPSSSSQVPKSGKWPFRSSPCQFSEVWDAWWERWARQMLTAWRSEQHFCHRDRS